MMGSVANLSRETAAADLQSVNPQSRPEQTLKEALQVLLSGDLAQLADDNEALIRELAQRCPIDDGFGVYIARAALLKIDTLPKNYISDCERIPSAEEIAEKQKLVERDGFLVYPNGIVKIMGRSIDYLILGFNQP